MGAAVAIGLGLVLLAVGLIVAGFLVYGMGLGLASLARSCRELWSQLVAANAEMQVAETAALDRSAGGAPATRESTKVHCWEFKQCPPEVRRSCAACRSPEVPCWLACMQASDDYPLKPACLACKLFNLPMMVGA
jgi:hypothetical protein